MSSREKILAAVKNNQPALQPLPQLETLPAIQYADKQEQFTTVLKTIGGVVVPIDNTHAIAAYVKNNFSHCKNIVTTLPDIEEMEKLDEKLSPHFLENIEVAVVKALFAVAENGAVWVTDEEMRIRALPFICENLAVVVDQKNIVSNMQEGYQLIGTADYAFGVFIAGPSKTADIEQSLVLGAHGPKTMTVFIKE